MAPQTLLLWTRFAPQGIHFLRREYERFKNLSQECQDLTEMVEHLAGFILVQVNDRVQVGP